MMKNMKNEPILSVCIPTYNRPKDFEKCLKNIIPQITDEVEVVIRDDSPDDETEKITRSLLEGSGIRYRYVHGEKIGLDAANLFLIENASGRYIWWFSDDDEMKEGAIAHVLRIIRAHPEISFIWANFMIADSGLIAIPDREEGFFRDHNEVLELLGANLGLLSTFCAKREAALPGVEKGRKVSIGFGFASLMPVLTAIVSGGKNYFLKGPYVICHPTPREEIVAETTKGGKIENNGFRVFGVVFHDVIKSFEKNFSRRAVRTMLAKNFGQVWRGMVVGWAGGWDTPKGKRLTMLRLYWSYPECWVALPLFLLPRPVIILLYRMYKIFFEERKWKGLKKRKR